MYFGLHAKLLFYLFLRYWPISSRIKRKFQNFLWVEKVDSSKFCLVEWNQICRTKELGGLGTRNPRTHNKEGKWLWSFGVEMNLLWRKVVEAKYGSECGF